MLDLKRHVFFATVSAFPTPLLKQILPDLVPSQFSLLIFDARDFWVLHLLRVERSDLYGGSRDREDFLQFFDEPDVTVEFVFDARRKPALRDAAVVESRFSVPLATSSGSSVRCSFFEESFDVV